MKTSKEKAQFILSVFNFFLISKNWEDKGVILQLEQNAKVQNDFYNAVTHIKSKYAVFKQTMFLPAAMDKALGSWLETFLDTH